MKLTSGKTADKTDKSWNINGKFYYFVVSNKSSRRDGNCEHLRNAQ